MGEMGSAAPDFELLTTRCFSLQDQWRFASVSGDHNPMHLDRLAARRTQAGVPVVHGINALMWALDVHSSAQASRPLAGIAARFERFAAVGDEISLWSRTDRDVTRLELRSGATRLILVTVRHRPGSSLERPLAAPTGTANSSPVMPRPRELSLEEAAQDGGTIALPEADDFYPHIAAWIGGRRVAALVALSYLVGMVTPGLHSIFSSLDLALDDEDEGARALAYKVTRAHQIFRLLDIAVATAGMRGKVQAFVRLPPVAQPGLSELSALVRPGEFAGVRALVVGGSRGLGEVTAKLLAAGGARVAISYATGASDAEAVAAEIVAAGGSCDILPIDVREPVAPQVAPVPFPINQFYYFATTKIFLQKSELFSMAALADFQAVYVSGFVELCGALSARATDQIVGFYPSSVAVDERPRAMTEYAMAKAAGEILCADIDRSMPFIRVLVRRLPRILTDQTATVTPSETTPASEVMLDVVRQMMTLKAHDHREGCA